MQITHSSPDIYETIGVPTAFSEYIKFIADERSLPIFWTDEERQCLWATSLQKHVAAKLQSLKLEYESFCEASKDISWKDQWWGESGCLTMDDWKIVDAMWRSRAMDFDEYGLCLVPIMDMANHAMEDAANAMYWIEGPNKEAHLYLDGKDVIEPGEEVKIIYGLQKGASEMLFSYGFIDLDIPDAGAMMLGWEPPADDELRDAKMEALNLEPGIKLYTPQRSMDLVEWASSCVWAMSVNEEDGLRILLSQEEGNEETLQVWFKERQVTHKMDLERFLQKDRMREIFQLRAHSYVQARLEDEIAHRQQLSDRDPTEKVIQGIDPETSLQWALSERLRDLETRLLVRAYEAFRSKVEWLAARQDVQDYLAGKPLAHIPTYVAWEDDVDDQEAMKERQEELDLVAFLNNADIGQHHRGLLPAEDRWLEVEEPVLTNDHASEDKSTLSGGGIGEEALTMQEEFDLTKPIRQDSSSEESSELGSEAER